MFRSLKPDRESIAYNSMLLSSYYRIILLGCKTSDAYLRAWTNADNFFWASNTMIWGRFHDEQARFCFYCVLLIPLFKLTDPLMVCVNLQQCTPELQELAELCLRKFEPIRKVFWSKVVHAANHQEDQESLL